MKEVEIIKLGDVLGSEKSKDPYILIVSNGGEVVDYYNEILKRNSDGYKIQKTTIDIYERFGDMARGKIDKGKGRKGIEDGIPEVGEYYTLDNGTWHTSKITRVIEDCVLITKNSVYAIHSVAAFREKKLNELGI
jgi:hypothetical protein